MVRGRAGKAVGPKGYGYVWCGEGFELDRSLAGQGRKQPGEADARCATLRQNPGVRNS